MLCYDLRINDIPYYVPPSTCPRSCREIRDELDREIENYLDAIDVELHREDIEYPEEVRMRLMFRQLEVTR